MSAAGWTTAFLLPMFFAPAWAGETPVGSPSPKGAGNAWQRELARAEARFGVSLLAQGAWTRPAEGWPARAVLLVHGLDEPGAIWNDLAPALAQAGHVVLRLDYPDDQPVEASAARMATELRALRARGVEDLDLVAHSMGGLVSMAMLTAPAPTDTAPLPRIGRLITVGTPWGGSPMARLRGFLEWREATLRALDGQASLLDPVADGRGEAGTDLRPGSPFLVRLAQRPAPAGLHCTVIAGDLGGGALDATDRRLSALAEQRPELTRAVRRTRLFLARSDDRVGDGVVPLRSALARRTTDTVVLPASHAGLLRAKDGAAPAIPVILERLAAATDRSRAEAGPTSSPSPASPGSP